MRNMSGYKSLKLPLIIAAVAISLLVVAGLAIAIINAENQDWQETEYEQQETVAVWDTALTQAKLPVLNIGGKENPLRIGYKRQNA